MSTKLERETEACASRPKFSVGILAARIGFVGLLAATPAGMGCARDGMDFDARTPERHSASIGAEMSGRSSDGIRHIDKTAERASIISRAQDYIEKNGHAWMGEVHGGPEISAIFQKKLEEWSLQQGIDFSVFAGSSHRFTFEAKVGRDKNGDLAYLRAAGGFLRAIVFFDVNEKGVIVINVEGHS